MQSPDPRTFSPNGLNAYNPRPEYSPSNLNQKYASNFVATYELPVGLGKKYLNSKRPIGTDTGWLAVQWNPDLFGRQSFWNIQRLQSAAGKFLRSAGHCSRRKLKTYNYGLSKAYFTGKTSTQPIQFTDQCLCQHRTLGGWRFEALLRSLANAASENREFRRHQVLSILPSGCEPFCVLTTSTLLIEPNSEAPITILSIRHLVRSLT